MLNAFERHLKMDTSKLPDNYSINLMWLNKTLDETKPFIDSSQTESDLIDKVLSRGKKWKENNADAEVAIWYDSEFVTSEALKNTQAVLDKLKEKEGGSYNIKLKNIRDIDIVKNNPDVFSDYVPLYFRIDLLKFIICLNEIESNSKQAVIFTDMDVGEGRALEGQLSERMTKQELFDPETMEKLNAIGMQAISYEGRIENQFFQFINKPETINAVKLFINANLSRAVTALNFKNETLKRRLLPGVSGAVYNTMRSQLLPLIIGLINKDIKVNANLFDSNASNEMIPYDLKKHGSYPLGNYYMNIHNNLCLILEGSIPTEENCKRSSQQLKLPDLENLNDPRFNVMSFGRENLSTRSGRDHSEIIGNLISRKPADGTETYKCKHLEIIPENPIPERRNSAG